MLKGKGIFSKTTAYLGLATGISRFRSGLFCNRNPREARVAHTSRLKGGPSILPRRQTPRQKPHPRDMSKTEDDQLEQLRSVLARAYEKPESLAFRFIHALNRMTAKKPVIECLHLEK
jgi:hypothetical protein